MKTTPRAFALAALLVACGVALLDVPEQAPLVFRSPGQETNGQELTGFVIRGRVHLGGSPVSGARVKVLPHTRTSRVLITVPFARQSMTDENGRFEIKGIPPGPARIVVIPDRLPPSMQTLEVSGDAEVEVGLQTGVDLEGTVFSGGIPVANAAVSLRLSGPEAVGEARPFREAVTDAEGRYRLEGLDPGRSARMVIIASGYRPIELGVRTPEDIPPRIDLDPGVQMRGRIVATGGAPVEGVRIQAGQGEGYTAAALSGIGGEVRLGGLIPRPVVLRAHVDGYAPARLELQEPADGWTIILRRNGGVSGRAPAGSMLVVEAESGIYRRPVGPDGTFRWDGLPAGPVEAKAVDGSGRTLASRQVEIPEGAIAEGILLQP